MIFKKQLLTALLMGTYLSSEFNGRVVYSGYGFLLPVTKQKFKQNRRKELSKTSRKRNK